MPPLRRLRISIHASDSSVSARTLRSIMASCSSRSSAAAGPSEAESRIVDDDVRLDAQAAPCARRSARPHRRARRSTAATSGRAMALGRRSRRPERQAVCRGARPASAHAHSTRRYGASALPMPAEAPVINVTGRRSGVTTVRFRARRRRSGEARFGRAPKSREGRRPARADCPRIRRSGRPRRRSPTSSRPCAAARPRRANG